MFGRTNEDIIAYLIGEKHSKEMVDTFGQEKEAVYRQMCRDDKENTHLAPYAGEFLDWLKENNIPGTIATMSEKSNVDFYIKEFNLEKWFDTDKIVYSDGTIKGKPAPDIYEIAAEKLGLKPQECVVVEDAVSGIEAARAAGIGKIVAIASMESPDFYKDIPAVNLIIKDFRDFRAILEVEKAAV